MSYPPGPPSDGDSTPENPYGPPNDQPGSQPGSQPGYGQGQQPGYGQDQPGYGQGQQPGYEQGYPPAYGQQPGPGAGSTPKTNGKALASLITGISTLVLSWCCGLGIIGLVAVFLGFKARSEIRSSGGTQSGEGLALAGIITGAIATLIGLLGLAFLILAIASGNAEWNMNTYSDY